VERYGHYSLAAESMYDHPFQWGSKRTGPDLARVGGKYSDEWHVVHMQNPRAIVPESIMPGYPYLARRPLDYGDMAARLETNEEVGVPYTKEMIENAKADVERQLDPAAEGVKEFLQRYPKAQIRHFDGDPGNVSELDAVIAYLQMLGTLVDFAKFDAAGPNLR
jgi:cytochrome c oxidase cbb3-type subunit 2